MPRLPSIQLRFGIAMVFLVIMLPATLGMTWILYRENSRLAYDMAGSAMKASTRDVTASVLGLVGQMARVADTSVAFGLAEGNNLRRFNAMRLLVEELDKLPDAEAMYFGFAKDGAFREVIRVPQDGRPFGPKNQRPPEGARYVLRLVDTVGGERTDSFIYVSGWGKVVGVERAEKADYDPRQRPWYAPALLRKDIVITDVTVFNSTGKPGMTLSRQMTTDDGEVIGVFGVNLSTAQLSEFLGAHRVGNNGTVFILDQDGRLIGTPRPLLAVRQDGSRIEVAKAEDTGDRPIAQAVRLWKSSGYDNFRTDLEGSGEISRISFTRFPDSFRKEFGQSWVIGNIVAEDEFIAPLRRVSLLILEVGSVVLVLACIGVILASGILTSPIEALTEEAGRIRRLNLATETVVSSSVTEINSLAAAVGMMRAALRSFSVYVPRDLVLGILESNTGTVVGGKRQLVTVLFTDIASFTSISEAMPPEQVFDMLTTYFQTMSHAIHAHGGVIDKFIGDAIMALWNAPTEDDDHVIHACRAVLAARAAGTELNKRLAAEAQPPLATRFGLHTGPVLVGNVGSHDRMQYTALGATVNLASRIEALNKKYGTGCLVTGPVEEAARGHFLFRPMGLGIPSGTSIPVPLFELLDETNARLCEDWKTPFAAWESHDWPAAVAALRAFLVTYPEDRPAAIFLERCLTFLESPPGAGWDGALSFAEK